jgi:hypothetical protein
MKYLLVILAALATALSAWAAPAPLRVTGISPQVADRGELVTIAGSGFGAQNLEVTVGGDPVELVSATGSRASFRVPALGPVGEVVVEARNPGGHVGRIGLNVRFDGHTVAVADEAAAVSAPVGSEGVTIGVGAMSLAIPAGAVPAGTEITATPLRSLQGSPFAGAPIGLKLEPSGLVLLQPATLTLPKPVGEGTLVGFGFNGDGGGFRIVPHRVVGETVELSVWHFSGAGAATVSASELQAVLGYLPTPSHELAEQRIAAALASQATGGPPPGQTIFDALVAWRTSSVSRGLDLARTEARLDFFELAFGEWLAWRSYAQDYRELFDAGQRSFVATATGIDRATATDGAAAVARVLLPRCTGPAVPLGALRDVIRLASAVNLDLLPTNEEAAEDGTGRSLPDGRNLATACVDVQIVGVQHAAVLARDRDNRIMTRAHVTFWKGDPSGTVPLHYRLAETTGVPVPLASGTSSNGTFEATIEPETLALRRLEVTIDLDASGDDTVLRTFFDQTTFSVPVRERLELQALGSTTIGSGGTVPLRVRVAGDGMVGASVPLTVGGPGTVAPASVTTDANGEATAVYTAPADTLVTAASVNAVLADGTSTGVAITIAPFVLVGLSPVSTTLSPGQSVDLTATVTGTLVTAVTWTATGGVVTGTGANTARYVAGSMPGTFSVTATSIADPTATASSTITIADLPTGVVREASRGLASVSLTSVSTSCGFEYFKESGAGDTSWTDTISCSGAEGDDRASGTFTTSFAESYRGAHLTSVTAAGSGSASGRERGLGVSSGEYVVTVVLTHPTNVSFDATLATSSGNVSFFLVGPGIQLIHSAIGNLSETRTLQPGRYSLGISANAVGDNGSGSASFGLEVRFSR